MTTRLSIVGATASGKSELAQHLATSHPAVELVSIDAIAVYRGLDIGTAKPSLADRAAVHWHLLDLVDPHEEFSVKAFQLAAKEATTAIARRGGDIVLVGGTGLYHRAVVDNLEIPGRFPEIAARLEAQADQPGGVRGLYANLVQLDPTAASRIEPTNRRRLVRALEVTLGEERPFSSFGRGLSNYDLTSYRIVGISFPREELDGRIEARLDRQLACGFVDEVATLVSSSGGLSRTAQQAIGYRELLLHLEGAYSLEHAREEILRRSRNFARRQEAWFRRDPRIMWIDGSSTDALGQLVGHFAAEDKTSDVRQ